MADNVGLLTRQQFAIQELVNADPNRLDGSALCDAYNASISDIALVLPESLKAEFERNFKPAEKSSQGSSHDFFDAHLSDEKNRKVATASLLRLLGWIKGAIDVEKKSLERP